MKREGDGQGIREGARTVRFASIISAAGKPEVYLPLSDPKQDREFMRAVKANRVLSVRQEPTSKLADYGVVGFDEQKHTTYLVFPNSLAGFADARIVGIRYDVVGSSRVSTSPAPKFPKQKAGANRLATTARPSAKSPTRRTAPKRAPRKRVEPERKTFRVHLRVTIVREKDVEVEATTRADAKKKAQAAVQGEGNVHAVSVKEVS